MTDTSGDEEIESPGRLKDFSKKTWKMKKSHAAVEIGRFFVIGPTDAAERPNLLQELSQRCVWANKWDVRDPSAFSGCSSFPTVSARAVGNPWLAGSPIRCEPSCWWISRNTEGEDFAGSTCQVWPSTFVHRGFAGRWKWCSRSELASAREGVLFHGSPLARWQFWIRGEVLEPVHANC